MRGLVIGRFQPFHKGHEALIRSAIEDCVHVVVGVGSSNAKQSLQNPFTFEERKRMILAAFPNAEVVAVPDIHDPPRWASHVIDLVGPVDAVFGNDERTNALFEDDGFRVKARGLIDREKYEGKVVRMELAEGDGAWRKAVPAAVIPILDELEAGKRLRLLEATV